MLVARFLGLVLVLNVIRYVGGFVFEPFLIFPGLMGAMEQSAEYFRTEFQAFDWMTSYFYNFMMWLCCAWVYHLVRPNLRGSDLVASLKIFGILWISFASVSAIYMNHYSHPRDFYFWNVLDGLLVFALVGIANGLLYRRLMGSYAAAGDRHAAAGS